MTANKLDCAGCLDGCKATPGQKEKQVIQPKSEQAHFSVWSPVFRCVPMAHSSAGIAGLPGRDDKQRRCYSL